MEENNSQQIPVTPEPNTQDMQPVQPVYAQPEQPMQPVYAQPEQPMQPVYAQPQQPVQPVYAQPEQPVQPVYAQPEQPVQPVYAQPQQPVQPVYAQPQQPVQPVYAQPQQPVQSVYAQPQQPMQPLYAQPQQPMQPAQPPVPPTTPAQPVYGAVPPADGNGGKKKGKGGLIAIIIVIVVLLLAAAGVLAYKLFGTSPEKKLTQGIINLQAEMTANASPVSEQLGAEEIIRLLDEKPVTMDMSLNVSIPSLETTLDTVGIDYTVNYDLNNKLMDAQMKLSAMNMDLVGMDMAASGNTLYLSLPGLLTNSYFINTDTFGKDFNASPWTSLLDVPLDESLSFQLFNTDAASDDTDSNLFAEEIANIMATMKVEDSGTAVEIERDGKTVKCNGVKVTLEADALNELLDAFEKEFGQADSVNDMLSDYGIDEEFMSSSSSDLYKARVKNDVELYVYLDSKNRITNVATASKIRLKDSALTGISFSLVFSGSENVLDQVSGTVKLETEGNSAKIEVKRSAQQDASQTKSKLTLTFSGDNTDGQAVFTYTDKWDLDNMEFAKEFVISSDTEDVSLVLKGAFSDVQKGESFKLTIGEFALSSNGTDLVSASGEFSMAPYDGTIEVPENAVDLLAMSESDFEDMVTELITSVYSMLGLW